METKTNPPKYYIITDPLGDKNSHVAMDTIFTSTEEAKEALNNFTIYECPNWKELILCELIPVKRYLPVPFIEKEI